MLKPLLEVPTLPAGLSLTGVAEDMDSIFKFTLYENHTIAMRWVDRFFLRPGDVDAPSIEVRQLALGIYQQLVELGHVRAMVNLGWLYQEGLAGTELADQKTRDIKAVEYYQQAADLGDAAAFFHLGLLYMYERAGFIFLEQKARIKKTLEHFRRCIELRMPLEYSSSLYGLGRLAVELDEKARDKILIQYYLTGIRHFNDSRALNDLLSFPQEQIPETILPEVAKCCAIAINHDNSNSEAKKYLTKLAERSQHAVIQYYTCIQLDGDTRDKKIKSLIAGNPSAILGCLIDDDNLIINSAMKPKYFKEIATYQDLLSGFERTVLHSSGKITSPEPGTFLNLLPKELLILTESLIYRTIKAEQTNLTLNPAEVSLRLGRLYEEGKIGLDLPDQVMRDKLAEKYYVEAKKLGSIHARRQLHNLYLLGRAGLESACAEDLTGLKLTEAADSPLDKGCELVNQASRDKEVVSDILQAQSDGMNCEIFMDNLDWLRENDRLPRDTLAQVSQFYTKAITSDKGREKATEFLRKLADAHRNHVGVQYWASFLWDDENRDERIKVLIVGNPGAILQIVSDSNTDLSDEKHKYYIKEIEKQHKLMLTVFEKLTNKEPIRKQSTGNNRQRFFSSQPKLMLSHALTPSIALEQVILEEDEIRHNLAMISQLLGRCYKNGFLGDDLPNQMARDRKVVEYFEQALAMNVHLDSSSDVISLGASYVSLGKQMMNADQKAADKIVKEYFLRALNLLLHTTPHPYLESEGRIYVTSFLEAITFMNILCKDSRVSETTFIDIIKWHSQAAERNLDKNIKVKITESLKLLSELRKDNIKVQYYMCTVLDKDRGDTKIKELIARNPREALECLYEDRPTNLENYLKEIEKNYSSQLTTYELYLLRSRLSLSKLYKDTTFDRNLPYFPLPLSLLASENNITLVSNEILKEPEVADPTLNATSPRP